VGCEDCIWYKDGFCEYWEEETAPNDWCEFIDDDLEEDEILSFYN
jgi:hypothetical protein